MKTKRGEPRRWLDDLIATTTDECVFWPYGRTVSGYGVVWMSGRLIGAHKYVCERIHGKPPEGYEASHSCGKGHLGCVTPNHLRWATVSENQMDRVRHGTSNRGQRNASSKLTEDDVREIRRLAQNPAYSNKLIGALFGVSSTTVFEINKRRTWYWLDDQGEAA